jgi:hypothetical protein
MVLKAFFRYLRGELMNGFYIRKLNLVADKLDSMSLLKTELLYWMNVKFGSEFTEYPMRDADLKGIAQVAGILSIRGASAFLLGWFRMTESFIVGGKQRSERGMLDQNTGDTAYIRTSNDTYPTDISTDATEELRMSLIPDGTEPIGYVWGDNASVILESGMVDEAMLHLTPPEGYLLDPTTHKWYWPFDYQVSNPPIYAPWYGNEYLPLAASYPMTVALPDNFLEFLLRMQQSIKFNGISLVHIFDATSEMVYDLVEDLKIELIDGFPGSGYHSWYYKMTFTKLEDNFSINNGWSRFAAWAYFIQSKYPFIKFNESGN